MVRIGDGRSHFPLWIDASSWPASAPPPSARRCLDRGVGAGAPWPFPAGQARRGRLAAGRAGHTDLVALAAPSPETGLRFKRGEQLEVTLGNDLPVPAVLNWRGIDGVPSAEPLLARAPVAAGAKDTFQLPLRHAGTFLCDAGLLGDGQARPSPARAFVVHENEPVTVDRDEVLLIEDWRLRAGRHRDRARQRSEGHRCRSTPSMAGLRWISRSAPMNA